MSETAMWLVSEYQDEPAQVVVIDAGDESAPESWSTYVFHREFGHTVYERPMDLFKSRAAALAEAERRRAATEAKDEAEFDAWWKKNHDQLFAMARKTIDSPERV